MGHDKHFTTEQLTERFVFTDKIKRFVFILMGIGAVLVLLGLVFAEDPTKAHLHEEDADDHGHHSSIQAPASTDQQADVHFTQEIPPETIHEENGHGDDHGGGHGAVHPITKYTQALADILHNSLFFLTFALGGLFFICVHRVGNAGWQTAIKRIPEAMSMYIPFALIGFVILMPFAGGLFDWTHVHTVEDDHLIFQKLAYLNIPAWVIRTFVIFGVWFFIARTMRKLSMQSDEIGLDQEGNSMQWRKMLGIAAFFLIFYAFSVSLFSIDWIKSLEPHWFSTIFGVYNFAGTMASSMVVIGFLLYFLKRQGYMSYINDSHFHDVFKYAFGFSVFWGYIFVAQFLLIWYANIPEETFYYYNRFDDAGYKFLFFFNIMACFVVPFIGFMTRNAKRRPGWFLTIGVIMLIGHWTDQYLMIMPGAMREYSQFGLMEIGFFVLFLGGFLFAVFTSLTKANLAPLHHPYMEESLHHTTGPV